MPMNRQYEAMRSGKNHFESQWYELDKKLTHIRSTVEGWRDEAQHEVSCKLTLDKGARDAYDRVLDLIDGKETPNV